MYKAIVKLVPHVQVYCYTEWYQYPKQLYMYIHSAISYTFLLRCILVYFMHLTFPIFFSN